MDVLDKLQILTDAAKYDVACTSSGVDRRGKRDQLGSAAAAGICHSFSADGRCIALLKVLMTNACRCDCAYCINRVSNDRPRAAFTPEELADLTIGFYRRNYIEGLFLSSAICRSPDHTCEQMLSTLALLRSDRYRFNGYIHVKAIPGADPALIDRLGRLADRISVNIELPSKQGLVRLAPDKTPQAILKPMGQIREGITENRADRARFRQVPPFAPAGQSTQMIIGATADTDHQILTTTEKLYRRYALKRVFYSAHVPVNTHRLLPALKTRPPLLREHRLYQADWLLRFYGFRASEILDANHPDLNPLVDPKCSWALAHPEAFPVEVATAPKARLLRVPGIGVKSAARIVAARRQYPLDDGVLRQIGVVLKRARYFITCNGRRLDTGPGGAHQVLESLLSEKDRVALELGREQQLSFLETSPLFKKEVFRWLMG